MLICTLPKAPPVESHFIAFQVLAPRGIRPVRTEMPVFDEDLGPGPL